MKKSFTLILALLAVQALFAQRFDWATTGGASGIANSFGGALDIARDPQGNIYTVDFSNHAQQCQGDTLQPFVGITACLTQHIKTAGIIGFNIEGCKTTPHCAYPVHK